MTARRAGFSQQKRVFEKTLLTHTLMNTNEQ